MSLAPPFTLQTATRKVKIAQALWNTRDFKKVAAAYTPDSCWRNRAEFATGTAQIEDLLRRKWEREHDYVLRKELFAFGTDNIAVQLWYEARIAGTSDWIRCYGLEHWVFDAEGKMARRQMSGNDVPIVEADRWFKDGVDPDSVNIGPEHWTLDAPLSTGST